MSGKKKMLKKEIIKKIKNLNKLVNKKNGKLREKILNKIIKDNLLIGEYLEKGRTSIDISKELGVSSPYICKRIKKLNILRNKRESKKGYYNGLWKGNKVQYPALHMWVKRNKPKSQACEYCKKEGRLDLANISGEYKRDINDFRWLCRKCHMVEDGRLKRLKERIINQNKYNKVIKLNTKEDKNGKTTRR